MPLPSALSPGQYVRARVRVTMTTGGAALLVHSVEIASLDQPDPHRVEIAG